MTTQTTEKPRKERLLDSALELMIDKGYEATTVDEICEKAGVTKGSFFYYFKNKEDLGQKLLHYFAEMNAEKIQSSLCNIGTDPLERVYATIDCTIKMISQSNAKGCLVGTFAQELSESHPDIRNICAQLFKAATENFKKDLIEAKKQYAPKANFDVDSLADSYLALIQGTMIMIKAQQDRSIIQGTLKHYKLYLETLFQN